MDADTSNNAITAHQLVELGPSYRQVHYWYRQGYLVPENPHGGSGTGALTFSPEQAEIAVRMHRLTSVGIHPAAASRAVRNGGDLGNGVWIHFHEPIPGKPTTDGLSPA